MVNIVQSLFIAPYNLAKGKNQQGRFYYEDARQEATALLKGILKISIATSALFAVTACMNRLSTSYSLLGSSLLVAGGIVVGRKIASPFIINTFSIAGSLLLIREGCGTFVINPLIQSVKGALRGMAQKGITDIDLASCASGLAMGYFRGIVGVVSLGLGLKYIDTALKNEVKPTHFIDRGVHSFSKKCASCFISLLGYKKYTPPKDLLPRSDIRPIIK